MRADLHNGRPGRPKWDPRGPHCPACGDPWAESTRLPVDPSAKTPCGRVLDDNQVAHFQFSQTLRRRAEKRGQR